MYHAIIRAKLRTVFARLNVQDYRAVLEGFTPAFEHAFYGQHALGGIRHTLAATRLWYARLPRVLPDLHFTVKQIVVSGWPWNTHAAVEWTDTGLCLDGHRFNNQGVHIITIRWGKVSAVRIYCDTQVLTDCLARNAAQGLIDAELPPIAD